MVTDVLTLYDKNHIMSRIEKFLFAICSLDSSDLPIPLSRIEELYNCLVTGDTPPTFEPLSRAEKFLMACLGAYDINKLPEPLSRSEVLLKKIATGDNNLEDVDNLQSKYEFLLAYIIQNGGIDGDISYGDISYMKHTLTKKETTLYNTIEYPVKSAILKGNTLVNHINGHYEIQCEAGEYKRFTLMSEKTLPAGKYILMYDVVKSGGSASTSGDRNTPYYNLADGTAKYQGYENFNSTVGKKYWIINTDQEITKFTYWCAYRTEEIHVKDFVLLAYQDGMENWDIPFFTGMSSVKMPVLTTTGKNIFGGELINGYINSSGNWNGSSDNIGCKDFISITPNDKVAISLYNKSLTRVKATTYVRFYDINFNAIGSNIYFANSQDVIVTAPTNAKYLKFYYSGTTKLNVQIEQNSIITTYEPYKTNILTCNEEVELRGIGDIKDELNLVTGELTQRVGEVVFDGSENWIASTNQERIAYILPHNGVAKVFREPISDKWICSGNSSATFDEFFYIGASYFNYITNQEISLADFKAQLSDNPVSVKYFLATESNETVDLSIVNQDGNNTKLSTFNDITYVTLSSEGLIPEAELEVATKNEEVLNTLSLEMDDISAAQTTLEKTSNTQSENMDATMIATTEIYGGLL